MSINQFHRNIIFTFLIAIICLYVGLEILFLFRGLFPGDPVAAYLAARGIHNPSQELYQQTRCQLGFCDSIMEQYLKFIGALFTGNWRVSVSLILGEEVTSLIGDGIMKTVGLILLPLILGGGLGVLLGRISFNNRGTWKDKTIQLFSIIGISIPVFFLGMLFQYALCYELRICEPSGISALSIEILTFTLTAFITWQVRSFMINNPHERSLLSNTIKTGITFSFIFIFYLLVEDTFNINGFGAVLIAAFQQVDYFVIIACLFLMIILFVLTTIISNLFFSYYITRRSDLYEDNKETRYDDELNKVHNSADNKPEASIKEYLLIRLKSPFSVLGGILILIFIFIGIFPQAVTQYSLSETLSPSSGAWSPPSSGHSLGQTALGLDVLALIIWGIQDLLILSSGSVLIGLIGGSIFGFLAGKFKKWGYKVIMGLMVLFYVLPIVFFNIIMVSVFGPFFWSGIVLIGFFLIPIFTRVIANAMAGEISIHKISKAVISYIPLNFAIAIIIYTAIGFLGLDPLYSILGAENQPIQLGSVVRMGSYLSEAPWASLWPGFIIFIIVLGFLLIHLGLKDYQLKNQIEID